mmetsp:Transcript_305/g.383  ORF Transcript_305/g.383 Transcript_305/m.383 type:complete len:92 (+) Transcript_305:155-430(+)
MKGSSCFKKKITSMKGFECRAAFQPHSFGGYTCSAFASGLAGSFMNASFLKEAYTHPGSPRSPSATPRDLTPAVDKRFSAVRMKLNQKGQE